MHPRGRALLGCCRSPDHPAEGCRPLHPHGPVVFDSHPTASSTHPAVSGSIFFEIAMFVRFELKVSPMTLFSGKFNELLNEFLKFEAT